MTISRTISDRNEKYFDLNMYAIFDRKANLFQLPFCVPNRDGTNGLAKRAFLQMASREGEAMAVHPADFALYQIGHFDQESAQISPNEKLVLICDALQLITEYNNEQASLSNTSTDD
jgi:hypothetical protein